MKQIGSVLDFIFSIFGNPSGKEGESCGIVTLGPRRHEFGTVHREDNMMLSEMIISGYLIG